MFDSETQFCVDMQAATLLSPTGTPPTLATTPPYPQHGDSTHPYRQDPHGARNSSAHLTWKRPKKKAQLLRVVSPPRLSPVTPMMRLRRQKRSSPKR